MTKKETSGLKPFAATMMRNPVYDTTKDEHERRECLRQALEKEACDIITKSPYKEGRVKCGKHIANIEKLRERVTERCKSVLAPHNKRRLLFGTAQKYLNVELKRRWLDCGYELPPHCPFDYKIIRRMIAMGAFDGKLGGMKHLKPQRKHKNICRWTRSDTCEDYRVWVAAAEQAREMEGYDSLAEWELHAFCEERNKK